MLSNYDIKKILPRLIIAAVAVNLSFYICAALVDISNILGESVRSLIMGTASGSTVLGTVFDNNVGEAIGGFTGIAIIAVILFLTGSLSMVFLAVIMIFATLALRNVLLTVLIIISPIAFVLWLLPNTEKLFQKWRDNFVRALFVYPALMAVWGACNLMISIISGLDNKGLFELIMCFALAIAPAVAILPIMKMGGQAMGALQGLAQKGLNKAGGDALKKWEGDASKRRRDGIGGRVKSNLGNRFNNLAENGGGRVRRFIGRRGQGLMFSEDRHKQDMERWENEHAANFSRQRLQANNIDKEATIQEAEADANAVKAQVESAKSGRVRDNYGRLGELSRQQKSFSAQQKTNERLAERQYIDELANNRHGENLANIASAVGNQAGSGPGNAAEAARVRETVNAAIATQSDEENKRIDSYLSTLRTVDGAGNESIISPTQWAELARGNPNGLIDYATGNVIDAGDSRFQRRAAMMAGSSQNATENNDMIEYLSQNGDADMRETARDIGIKSSSLLTKGSQAGAIANGTWTRTSAALAVARTKIPPETLASADANDVRDMIYASQGYTYNAGTQTWDAPPVGYAQTPAELAAQNSLINSLDNMSDDQAGMFKAAAANAPGSDIAAALGAAPSIALHWV